MLSEFDIMIINLMIINLRLGKSLFDVFISNDIMYKDFFLKNTYYKLRIKKPHETHFNSHVQVNLVVLQWQVWHIIY